MITKRNTKPNKERNLMAPHNAPRAKRLHGAIARNAELAGVDRGYVAKVHVTRDAKPHWKEFGSSGRKKS